MTALKSDRASHCRVERHFNAPVVCQACARAEQREDLIQELVNRTGVDFAGETDPKRWLDQYAYSVRAEQQEADAKYLNALAAHFRTNAAGTMAQHDADILDAAAAAIRAQGGER